LAACSSDYSSFSESSVAPIADVQRSINQNNNLLYTGFAIMIDDNIYFGDGIGIHRTNARFENIETLVFNEDYQDAVDRAVFRYLQYYDGKIYFLHATQSTINVMDMDGREVTTLVSASQFESEGILSGFIAINNKIYFNFFDFSHEGYFLKSFDFSTGEIIDFNLLHTPMLSLSPDRSELHFAYDLGELTALHLENGDVHSIMPLNFWTLVENSKLFGIIFRTVSDGKIVVAGHGTILVITEDGYAEEIYHTGPFNQNINAIDSWVYFIRISPRIEPRAPRDMHLYRVKNDGSEVERVFEHIAFMNPGIPQVVLNIFSEDLILFKTSSTRHEIFALVRDDNTGELVMIGVNTTLTQGD